MDPRRLTRRTCACGHGPTDHPGRVQRRCQASRCHCAGYLPVGQPRCSSCRHWPAVHAGGDWPWPCAAFGCRCDAWHTASEESSRGPTDPGAPGAASRRDLVEDQPQMCSATRQRVLHPAVVVEVRALDQGCQYDSEPERLHVEFSQSAVTLALPDLGNRQVAIRETATGRAEIVLSRPTGRAMSRNRDG